MERVLVAMSGGVDSSVAAYLLKEQGYDVIGATMRLYDDQIAGGVNAGVCSTGHTCCSIDDVEDAKSVAHRLGIPHYTFDYTDAFEDAVIRPFSEAYEQGRTPNPCIECNRHLKFSHLLERAQELGCTYMATGHYAQIVRSSADDANDPDGVGSALGAGSVLGMGGADGTLSLDSTNSTDSADGSCSANGTAYKLTRGVDARKDQSYVLYMLTAEQRAHVLFPLGNLTKPEVRAIAEEQGFINARKHESQDICFVPDGDYVGFLERYTKTHPEPGEIVDTSGTVLGHHVGLVSYTVGQRKGLGIAAPEPLYVIAKDAVNNRLIVGPRTSLESAGCVVSDWNWIYDAPCDGESIPAMVKTHYREIPHPAHLSLDVVGRVRVTYDAPSRIAAPGQACVAYDGDYVIGGGTIESAF